MADVDQAQAQQQRVESKLLIMYRARCRPFEAAARHGHPMWPAVPSQSPLTVRWFSTLQRTRAAGSTQNSSLYALHVIARAFVLPCWLYVQYNGGLGCKPSRRREEGLLFFAPATIPTFATGRPTDGSTGHMRVHVTEG